jgi:hypothetical protein
MGERRHLILEQPLIRQLKVKLINALILYRVSITPISFSISGPLSLFTALAFLSKFATLGCTVLFLIDKEWENDICV